MSTFGAPLPVVWHGDIANDFRLQNTRKRGIEKIDFLRFSLCHHKANYSFHINDILLDPTH